MTHDDTMEGEAVRLMTQAEACRELRVSLSTLNRRIAAGEVPVKREPRGGRHLLYVMLDDDEPSAADTPKSELTVAQERIRALEEQLELLQGQLDQERPRNAELAGELKSTQERRGSWWRGSWWRLQRGKG